MSCVYITVQEWIWSRGIDIPQTGTEKHRKTAHTKVTELVLVQDQNTCYFYSITLLKLDTYPAAIALKL